MLATKCGSITLSQTVWNGNTHHSHKKNLNNRKGCALGITETNPWALSGIGVTITHSTMNLCMISWSWWFRVNTEGIWQKRCAAARECLYPYYYQPHCSDGSDTPETMISDLTISTIQPWPCTSWFSSVWTPQRCFKRSLFCQWTWANGDGEYVAYELDENIF